MESDNVSRTSSPPSQEADPSMPRLILDALARLRFGSIQLTIHEGKLVQIDITEKTRLHV